MPAGGAAGRSPPAPTPICPVGCHPCGRPIGPLPDINPVHGYGCAYCAMGAVGHRGARGRCLTAYGAVGVSSGRVSVSPVGGLSAPDACFPGGGGVSGPVPPCACCVPPVCCGVVVGSGRLRAVPRYSGLTGSCGLPVDPAPRFEVLAWVWCCPYCPIRVSGGAAVHASFSPSRFGPGPCLFRVGIWAPCVYVYARQAASGNPRNPSSHWSAPDASASCPCLSRSRNRR